MRAASTADWHSPVNHCKSTRYCCYCYKYYEYHYWYNTISIVHDNRPAVFRFIQWRCQKIMKNSSREFFGRRSTENCSKCENWQQSSIDQRPYADSPLRLRDEWRSDMHFCISSAHLHFLHTLTMLRWSTHRSSITYHALFGHCINWDVSSIWWRWKWPWPPIQFLPFWSRRWYTRRIEGNFTIEYAKCLIYNTVLSISISDVPPWTELITDWCINLFICVEENDRFKEWKTCTCTFGSVTTVADPGAPLVTDLPPASQHPSLNGMSVTNHDKSNYSPAKPSNEKVKLRTMHITAHVPCAWRQGWGVLGILQITWRRFHTETVNSPFV